jgi:hypothetical protein
LATASVQKAFSLPATKELSPVSDFYDDIWCTFEWLENAFGFERSMVISDNEDRLTAWEPGVRFSASTPH